MKTNNNTHQAQLKRQQIFTIIAHSMLDESILIRIFLKAPVTLVSCLFESAVSLAQVSF
jgi:hypothetical protein